MSDTNKANVTEEKLQSENMSTGEEKFGDRYVKDILNQLDAHRHKAVKPFYIVSIVLTMVFYFCIVYFSVTGFGEHKLMRTIAGLLGLPEMLFTSFQRGGLVLLIVIILFLGFKIFSAIINEIKETSVEGAAVTQTQFKEIYELNQQYCKLLGITKIPRIYVTTHLRTATFAGIPVTSRDVIRLSAYLSMDESAVKFMLARELSKYYYHEVGVKYILLTLVGKLIPVFSQAYGRAMEYSYDRAAQIITESDSPAEEIAKLAMEYYIKKQINFGEYTEYIKKDAALSERSAWRSANRYSYVPISQYRINAMVDPEMKDGKLF